MNVNGAADLPHNGRRCQHYLMPRRLNSEQREDRDDGLIFFITPAPTMVSHDLAKTTAVAMGPWRDSRGRLAFVSPQIITATIDRASSLREAEAKDRLNKD
jgi:hypothetical protein